MLHFEQIAKKMHLQGGLLQTSVAHQVWAVQDGRDSIQIVRRPQHTIYTPRPVEDFVCWLTNDDRVQIPIQQTKFVRDVINRHVKVMCLPTIPWMPVGRVIVHAAHNADKVIVPATHVYIKKYAMFTFDQRTRKVNLADIASVKEVTNKKAASEWRKTVTEFFNVLDVRAKMGVFDDLNVDHLNTHKEAYFEDRVIRAMREHDVESFLAAYLDQGFTYMTRQVISALKIHRASGVQHMRSLYNRERKTIRIRAGAVNLKVE